MTATSRPRVAVVGRPNVGKSTLVNRFASSRRAIVGPTPGLTRDRLDIEIDWNGMSFLVSDTGGLVSTTHQTGSVAAKAAGMAVSTLETASVVLFVVDVSTGPISADQELAQRLLRIDAPVLLVANKADDLASELAASEFWGLGLGEPVPTSALHGRGTGELLDRIVELLPDEEDAPTESAQQASISIVGRPNVGKSSLFNCIVGSDRSIVDELPGTTRDSVDTLADVNGTTYRFLDTAGLRKRTRTKGLEILSAGRTRTAIERSDVSICVIDGSEGPMGYDQKIAQQVAASGVSALVAINKWDLVSVDEAAGVESAIDQLLNFVDYAPRVRTCATSGRGVGKLKDFLGVLTQERERRIPTGPLNKLIAAAQDSHPPPRSRQSEVKVLYATQVSSSPPEIVLFTKGRPPDSWLRYLESSIRKEHGFVGSPIRLRVTERPARSAASGRTR